ncbi:MAG: mercury methylation corrinoid protein HgcA [Desulfovibrionaceae bacterium]
MLPWQYSRPRPAPPARHDYDDPGEDHPRMADGVVATPAGEVVRVRTRVGLGERLAALAAGLEPERAAHHVVPALYAVGDPGPDTPVLACSNHKSEFDALRTGLGRSRTGRNAWILVLDTQGRRAWTAARQGYATTSGLMAAAEAANLRAIAPHGVLLLPPQFATVLSLQEAAEATGFEAVWGPHRPDDAGACLDAGLRCDEAMRRPRFPLAERLALAPAALWRLRRVAFWALVACLVLSAPGPWGLSMRHAAADGQLLALALLLGVLAGAVLTPALLPWLPGRALAVRGACAGLLAALPLVLALGARPGPLASAALTLAVAATASRLASDLARTPEHPELADAAGDPRRFGPWQWIAAALAVILWLFRGLTPGGL